MGAGNVLKQCTGMHVAFRCISMYFLCMERSALHLPVRMLKDAESKAPKVILAYLPFFV